MASQVLMSVKRTPLHQKNISLRIMIMSDLTESVLQHGQRRPRLVGRPPGQWLIIVIRVRLLLRSILLLLHAAVSQDQQNLESMLYRQCLHACLGLAGKGLQQWFRAVSVGGSHNRQCLAGHYVCS